MDRLMEKLDLSSWGFVDPYLMELEGWMGSIEARPLFFYGKKH